MRVSFTMYLMIIYAILFILDILSFIKGKENKEWMSFKIITTIMIIGIVLLGYWWIKSPM